MTVDPWHDIRTKNQALGAAVLHARLKLNLSQPLLIWKLDPNGTVPSLNVPMLSRIESGTIVPSNRIAELIWDWFKSLGDDFTLPHVNPVTRTTDPHTSHDAARSVDTIRMRELHHWWLKHLGWCAEHMDKWDQLNFNGEPRGYFATDEGARRFYDGPKVSDSGFRTRRAELRNAGLVIDSGYRYTISTGRHAIAWTLSPTGLDLIKETP